MVKPLFNCDDYEDLACMSFENEEEYHLFRVYLDSVGKTWASGDSFIKWSKTYSDGLAIYFNQGTYGSVRGATANDRTVLKYSDFRYSDSDPVEDDTEYSITFEDVFGF